MLQAMTLSAGTAAAIKADVEATDSAKERAALLEAIIEIVYNDVKYNHIGGEGPDGRDGIERDAIGEVLDLARNHNAHTIH